MQFYTTQPPLSTKDVSCPEYYLQTRQTDEKQRISFWSPEETKPAVRMLRSHWWHCHQNLQTRRWIHTQKVYLSKRVLLPACTGCCWFNMKHVRNVCRKRTWLLCLVGEERRCKTQNMSGIGFRVMRPMNLVTVWWWHGPKLSRWTKRRVAVETRLTFPNTVRECMWGKHSACKMHALVFFRSIQNLILEMFP